ncbi:MAG TPA: GNAT family N-acetyltransferase [Fimbriimonadaceae bacterium]|nr:GNAT family N-acetyltransferase [Fimbriimonadaceae bacterium]
MRIIKISPERWQEYRSIRLEALKTDPDAFGATLKATLQRPDEWWANVLQIAKSDPDKTVVFAEVEGELVGMAGAYPEDEDGCVDVVGMFVRPDQRGKGIGRALLQAVVDEVQADTIRLCVNASMPAAVALYRSFGFETLSECMGTRSDGSTFPQIFMELRRPKKNESD